MLNPLFSSTILLFLLFASACLLTAADPSCFETKKCEVAVSGIFNDREDTMNKEKMFYTCIPESAVADGSELLGNKKDKQIDRKKPSAEGKKPGEKSCATMYKRPVSQNDAVPVLVGPCGGDVLPSDSPCMEIKL